MLKDKIKPESVHRCIEAFVKSRFWAYQKSAGNRDIPFTNLQRKLRIITQIERELKVAKSQGKTLRGYCVMLLRLRSDIEQLYPSPYSSASHITLMNSMKGLIEEMERIGIDYGIVNLNNN